MHLIDTYNHKKSIHWSFSKWNPLVSYVKIVSVFSRMFNYWTYFFIIPNLKKDHSKSKKDNFDIKSSNDSSFISILLSVNNDSTSSSDKWIQFIEYQMRNLKKKMEKLRKKRKAILMKKQTKSSRKSQKTISNILQKEMKS